MFLFRRSLAKALWIKSSQGAQIRSMSGSKPILYGDEASPPVRFVLMTASVLNVDLEFHKIDLFKEENRTDFFKKINPLQKVPALSIDGATICDSHAIGLYLCQIKKNNDLYPDDIVLRAKINEMLYFNSGVLFPIDSDIFTEFFAGKTSLNELKVNKWYSALDHLELKLNEQKFLADDKVRLCDLCCGATVSTLETLVPLLERHQKLNDWLKNLKLLSCFTINNRGLNRLQSLVNAMKLQQNNNCPYM